MSVAMPKAIRMVVLSTWTTVALLWMAASEGADAARPLTLLQPDKADFKAVPGAAKCNKMANLRGDLATGPSTFLTQLTAGCVAPWHWHTATEEIVVLKGEAVMQMKGDAPVTLPAGAYSQLPPKHLHRFRCTKAGECVVLVIADAAFDIHWVNAGGAEISLEEAMKLAAQDGAKGW
jgi:quercetin dioxygenase-like cupin family protein